MKTISKIIFNLTVLFLFILAFLGLIFLAQQIPLHVEYLMHDIEELNRYLTQSPLDTTSIKISQDLVANDQNNLLKTVLYLVLSCLAVLSCIFIFIYSNPKLFRKSTYTDISAEWAKNKAERAAAKQTKAEKEKQKRIEKLQAEIYALHGDEN